MKHILLIATGGTIASRHTAEGLAPRITPEELLSYVPDAASFCSIDTVQPINLDSTNIRPEHWLLLAILSRKTTTATTALSSATARTPWPTPPLPCPI